MRIKKRVSKKALSPIIATILLIAMVVVIGVLIFLWFQGMQKEALTKFEGRNIKQVCADVNFEVDYSGGNLNILNKGNVPINDFDIQVIKSEGSYETITLGEGVGLGGSISTPKAFEGDKIVVSPVLVGKTSTGEMKSYSCDSEKYGKTLDI